VSKLDAKLEKNLFSGLIRAGVTNMGSRWNKMRFVLKQRRQIGDQTGRRYAAKFRAGVNRLIEF
jgi:hypothetical protein